MKKEVHIWDLPSEKVYIKLNSKFREMFFIKAYEKFNNWRLLGEYLGIKRGDTVIPGNWKRGTCSCPLDIIFKIGNLIGVSKREIEKNISQIKAKTRLNRRGGCTGKPLYNPKFPLKINEDFAELLGHICGDGTIALGNPKKGIRTAYTNSELILIEYFDNLIKKVFGDVEPRIVKREGWNYKVPNYQIIYPTIVSYIFLSIFKYKSTNNGQELPRFIFNMNSKSKCRFIRALFDDEGYVNLKSKHLRIGMKPLNCIKGIQYILQEMGIKTTTIKKEIRTNTYVHYVWISNKKGMNTFHNKINFKHPMKKERLNQIMGS